MVVTSSLAISEGLVDQLTMISVRRIRNTWAPAKEVARRKQLHFVLAGGSFDTANAASDEKE